MEKKFYNHYNERQMGHLLGLQIVSNLRGYNLQVISSIQMFCKYRWIVTTISSMVKILSGASYT